MTEAAIAADDVDAVNPCSCQVSARILDDVLIKVDGHDVTAGADEAGQQGRVIAGARPDLENTLARLNVELLEHHRHD
jgi:hypothetical protein